MLIQVVHCHPLVESFDHALFRTIVATLKQNGHKVVATDLYREEFQPAMTEQERQTYMGMSYDTTAVAHYAKTLKEVEGLILCFPHWWFSMPAMLKGWVDRVWNNGWAYGDTTLPHRKALLIGTASGGAATYDKRQYGPAMQAQLVVGIMNYCGIPAAELELMFDVMDTPEIRAGHLARAGKLGEAFAVASA